MICKKILSYVVDFTKYSILLNMWNIGLQIDSWYITDKYGILQLLPL